jgi:hypothetical protein
LGKGLGEVQEIMRKGGETCGLGQDFTRGSKELLRLSRKGERGWVKPRVTHLLQSMEVPTEIDPGGSLILVLFRKATPSLQLTREACTHQFNIHRAQLHPGASHAELKRHMTGEQRADLIEADRQTILIKKLLNVKHLIHDMIAP